MTVETAAGSSVPVLPMASIALRANTSSRPPGRLDQRLPRPARPIDPEAMIASSRSRSLLSPRKVQELGNRRLRVLTDTAKRHDCLGPNIELDLGLGQKLA